MMTTMMTMMMMMKMMMMKMMMMMMNILLHLSALNFSKIATEKPSLQCHFRLC